MRERERVRFTTYQNILVIAIMMMMKRRVKFPRQRKLVKVVLFLFAALFVLPAIGMESDGQVETPTPIPAPTPQQQQEEVSRSDISDLDIENLAAKIVSSGTLSDMISSNIAREMEADKEVDGRDTVLARLQNSPSTQAEFPQWSMDFNWQKQPPMPGSPGIEYLLRGYDPQHVEFKQLPFDFGLYGGAPTYDGFIVPKGMTFAVDDRVYTDVYMLQGGLHAREMLCGDMVAIYPSACADMYVTFPSQCCSAKNI